jgi:hypothetical protein
MSDLIIQSGSVTALRLFDIAYSIDLKKAEALWADRAGQSATRSRLVSAPVKALAFDVPPLLIPLDPVTVRIGETDLRARVSARLYDFGVVSLSIRFPIEGMGWEEYTRFANAIDRSIGPNVRGGPWADLLERITTVLAGALTRPFPVPLEEDHLVATVQRWNETIPTADLLERIDLVPLLSGEERPLSEKSRKDLLRHRFSYYEDDLAVVTWDRAFILEPRNDTDVADILEVANAQLLEFRYYDELLDDELPRMYELVKSARRRLSLLGARRFADLARTLYTQVAEVTELTERADNVLQVTEDVYLARVYRAALEIFGVPTVGAAVDRKLGIIRDTYSALYAEASGARGELLEVAIILLIIIEIGIALARHAG